MKTYKANKNHPYLKEGLEVNENGSAIESDITFSIQPRFKPEWYDEVEPPRWRAKEHGVYYYIDYGNVFYSSEDDAGIDDERYNSGNYFQTKEQAEEYARRCKALALEYHKEIAL